MSPPAVCTGGLSYRFHILVCVTDLTTGDGGRTRPFRVIIGQARQANLHVVETIGRGTFQSKGAEGREWRGRVFAVRVMGSGGRLPGAPGARFGRKWPYLSKGSRIHVRNAAGTEALDHLHHQHSSDILQDDGNSQK